MIFGIISGILYARWGFGKEGELPRLNFTYGPFTNGMILIYGGWVVFCIHKAKKGVESILFTAFHCVLARATLGKNVICELANGFFLKTCKYA